MKPRLYLLALIAFACGLTPACGASSNHAGFTPGSGSDAGSGGDGPMTSSEGGPIFNGDASGIDACTGTRCSADLHSVVDCSGNVVSSCPANQGCSNGGCIAPCDAAAADKSTIGCDYFSVVPDVYFPGEGGCFAAYVANTWDTPVTITADYDGMTLDPTKFAYIPTGSGKGLTYAPLTSGQLQPGQVAILFLNNLPATGIEALALASSGLNINCPADVTAAIGTLDAAQHGTGIGHAFHIATTAPVVAYDIYPYGGGQSALTSATLLLPTSAWDTNYIAVDAYAMSEIGTTEDAGSDVGEPLPFVDFVAQTDGTVITINPSADIAGGTGVSVATKGMPQKYGPFTRGQVLHIAQEDELVGSVVQSNFPIGAWGGHQCLNISPTTPACDAAHQQIPPVRALGSEYVGVRYRDRWAGVDETVPWRIVGAVDGTVLTYEPSAPSGAPVTLAQGQMAEFDSGGLFVVKSQDSLHPFYMAGYMTGGATIPNASNGDGRGDPEFVNVIPSAEYLASYTFFTDPTYPETDLVVVRTGSNGAFEDVSLDCAGVLTGWQPLGAAGTYEYTHVDLVTGDFQAQGACNNGRHVMSSKTPFGLTVWGWGSAASGAFVSQWVSYAYPAGQSVAPINTVVVPAVPQ